MYLKFKLFSSLELSFKWAMLLSVHLYINIVDFLCSVKNNIHITDTLSRLSAKIVASVDKLPDI